MEDSRQWAAACIVGAPGVCAENMRRKARHGGGQRARREQGDGPVRDVMSAACVADHTFQG